MLSFTWQSMLGVAKSNLIFVGVTKVWTPSETVEKDEFADPGFPDNLPF